MREDVKLGSLASDSAGRDAIHIAVAPVIASEDLLPGQHVGLDSKGKARSAGPHVGIVDPFIQGKTPIRKGQRFFLCLYPGSIVSLRHHWEHPAFVERSKSEQLTDKDFSREWLMRYAIRMNCYDEPHVAFTRLIEGLQSGELYSRGSTLHGLHDLDDAEELKRHAETYLGIKIDWDGFSFSCSC